MSIILTVMSIFLLYIRRFNKDFESEQTTVFIAACIVIFALCCGYIAITQ
jgi:hypothetical protein